jgi:hypothetical protein
MRPFLLTPGAARIASAPCSSPSTLSRLLLPLHPQINGRHEHNNQHLHVHASSSSSSSSPSPLAYLRLRNRRGRFFASSGSQVRPTRLSASVSDHSFLLCNPFPGGPSVRWKAFAAALDLAGSDHLLFAWLCLQMAAPADAPGGSVDAFEVIRAHQVRPWALLVVQGDCVCDYLV